MEREETQSPNSRTKRDREIWIIPTKIMFNLFTWRCGLVVDIWLRDQEVPGSSPGFAR